MRWIKSPRLLATPIHITPETTVPALLDAACDRAPNPTALNQSSSTGWRSLSNHAFREQCRTVAQGLLSLGLQAGDRVALLIQNDTRFAIADMGSLMAGLIDVPIDVTQTLENIIFILQHSEARLLFVTQADWLEQLLPYLDQLPLLQHIVVESVPDSRADLEKQGAISAKCSSAGTVLPHSCRIISLAELQNRGQERAEQGLLPVLSGL